MASSDSDNYYTDEDEETDYTDDDDEDDDDEDEVEDEGEEDEDDEEDSEYSFEDEEDDDEDEDDDDDEYEDVEDLAEDDDNAEEEEMGSDTDDDDEVPALEHGQQDEISEGPDAPLSGLSTPVDPVADDARAPSLPSTEAAADNIKEMPLLKGNPNPASTDLASAAPHLEATTVSSLATNLDNVKIESPPSG